MIVILALPILIIAVMLSPATQPQNEPPDPAAAAAVEGYLQAIADGDAQAALTFLEEAPADTTFLTDEMLAASNALAPITDIEVTDPGSGSYYTRVTVSYSIGGELASTTFSASKYYDDDDHWLLSEGTAEMTLDPGLAGLDVTLNGQPVDGSFVVFFPGSYELATTTPLYRLDGPTTFAVLDYYDTPYLGEVKPALTQEGAELFRATVTSAVAECLASTTLSAGCGLSIPATLKDGSRLIDGTVTRTLSASAQSRLDDFAPGVWWDEARMIPGTYLGSVTTTAQCSKLGVTRTCSVYDSTLGTPTVDFAASPPTVVRWDQ